MQLLILGASGDQGLPQVTAATASGHRVRAAARNAERLRTRAPAATECVALDYAEPRSIAAAMRDVDVVLANFPSSSFNDGAALIAAAETTGRAARDAGVALIVFNTSMPVQSAALNMAAHDVRLAMREALISGGVPVTTLQPVVFMDNLLRGWAFPHIAERDRFVYPHSPDLRVSWICQRDLAALMLAAAERPGLAGRRFAVGGPEAICGREVAEALSEASQRPIRFESQSVSDFCAAVAPNFRTTDADASRKMLSELGKIYRWYNESPLQPFNIDMGPVLAELPVRLTPFREWAARQTWSRTAGAG